jgi:CHAT domain-containing protein/Tfp pilus assembly protein PilF
MALDKQDTNQTIQLLKEQPVQAIKYFESKLDSALIKYSNGMTNESGLDMNLLTFLSNTYQKLFQDNYLSDRQLRFNRFFTRNLTEKINVISLKAEAGSKFYKGHYGEAINMYNQLLDLTQKIGDIDEEAALLGNIGAAYFYSGEFDLALEFYQKSLLLLQKIGDKRRIGNRLGNIASLYSDKSDYETALAYYEQANTFRQEINDQFGQAADLNNIGLIYEETGRYNEALVYYNKAYQINKKIKNNRSLTKNLANCGNIYLQLGEYQKALDAYQEALRIKRILKDLNGEGNVLGNLGLLYQSLGDYASALGCFQKALSIHEKIGFLEGKAYQLGRIGAIYSLKGEYTEAIKYYLEATVIHKNLGHIHGEARWLQALGEIYFIIGDYQLAFEKISAALTLEQKIGDKSGEASVVEKLGRLNLYREDYKLAEENFVQALQIHQQIGERWFESQDYCNIAYVKSLQGKISEAIEFWQKAENFAIETKENNLLVWIKFQQGDFYHSQGDLLKAMSYFDQGLELSKNIIDPEIKWQLFMGKGTVLEEKEEYSTALRFYQSAITIIEQIRWSTTIEEIKAGIIHNRFYPYEKIVRLLLRLNRPEDAFEYVERARARNLLDLLGNKKITLDGSKTEDQMEKEQLLRAKITKLYSQISRETNQSSENVRGPLINEYNNELNKAQREYKNFLMELKLHNSEYYEMVKIEPCDINSVQRLLSEDTALLEYFFTKENLAIFVIKKDGLKVIDVPVVEKNLRGKLILFRGTAIEELNEKSFKELYWIKPLQSLYEILIKPVEQSGALAGIKHLIFVPQGILHYLPFAALVSHVAAGESSGIRPHFLIEDYIISHSPSASVLKYFHENNKNSHESLLLFAPNISTLPKSEEEVFEIAKLFGENGKYFLNGEATESQVKSSGWNFDMIHFATRAHFNKTNPFFSRIELAPSDQDDGYLEVHEIFDLNLNASFICLSACQTSLGSGYTNLFPLGDDFVSLSRAFISAGASSVLASLWEIADLSTAVFMKQFYSYMKKMDKSEALARTQRDMINGALNKQLSEDIKIYYHPYYWAAFVLVGNW